VSRSDIERVRERIEAIDRPESKVQRCGGDPDVARVVFGAVRCRLTTIAEAVESFVAADGRGSPCRCSATTWHVCTS
jgi:hypothetical protein